MPAFEKPHERPKLIEKTKDLQFRPSAPMPKGLQASVNKTESSMENRKNSNTADLKGVLATANSFDNRVGGTTEFEPNSSTEGQYVPMTQNLL